MSDELRPDPVQLITLPTAPLRREAMLPAERNRGLGTIALVFTMTGVASGLALATTLMAMQVTGHTGAPRARQCPHLVRSHVGHVETRGFLGIQYAFANGAINVTGTTEGSPAETVGIQRGDKLIAVNGDRVDSDDEMFQVISTAHPGSHPVIVLERAGVMRTVTPELASLIVTH